MVSNDEDMSTRAPDQKHMCFLPLSVPTTHTNTPQIISHIMQKNDPPHPPIAEKRVINDVECAEVRADGL